MFCCAREGETEKMEKENKKKKVVQLGVFRVKVGIFFEGLHWGLAIELPIVKYGSRLLQWALIHQLTNNNARKTKLGFQWTSLSLYQVSFQILVIYLLSIFFQSCLKNGKI